MAARKLQSKATTRLPFDLSLCQRLPAFLRRFKPNGKQLWVHKRRADGCSPESCFQRCSSLAQTSRRGALVAPPSNAGGDEARIQWL